MLTPREKSPLPENVPRGYQYLSHWHDSILKKIYSKGKNQTHVHLPLGNTRPVRQLLYSKLHQLSIIKPDVLSRIAQTTAAVTKLKVIWNNKYITISSKIKLMRSLAMSIFLHAIWHINHNSRHWKKDTGIGDEMISANSSVSCTEITQPTRKWKPELETPLGLMKTSWLQWKDANWSGTGTSQDHLEWPRLPYRQQYKEGDQEADRENDGKTTSKSGLALNGIYYYGKKRTVRSGGSWL